MGFIGGGGNIAITTAIIFNFLLFKDLHGLRAPTIYSLTRS